MPRFCASCGAAMAEGSLTCSACGKANAQSVGGGTAVAPAHSAPATGLTDNVAGLLAYVTIIPAIIFLVMEPYNRNRFVRFHSFQSLFFCVACVILGIALSVVSAIPFVALLGLFIWPLVAIAELAVWLLLVIKAYQGQMFKLPVIGDIAEKQASGTV